MRQNYIEVRRGRKFRALLSADMCVPPDEVVMVLAALLADSNKQFVFIIVYCF
jgi:hypothetical protein